MAQPPGYIEEGAENQAWLLHKALYGLKQAPRAWYLDLRTTLEHMGFIQAATAPALYICGSGSTRVILPVHVDDIITQAGQS